MSDNNFQPDLFGGQYYDKDGQKPGLKRGLMPYVRIPVEYTIIGGIIFLVLLVVFYAIGVERGKKIAQERMVFQESAKIEKPSFGSKPEAKPEKPAAGSLSESSTDDTGAAVDGLPDLPESAADLDETLKEDADIPGLPKEVKSAVPVVGGAYAIQLASTKNAEAAKKEVDKLKAKGKNACVIPSGQWHQICIRGYQSMEEARKDKTVLSKDYPDCYVKKLK
jgi:hypothetical protein